MYFLIVQVQLQGRTQGPTEVAIPKASPLLKFCSHHQTIRNEINIRRASWRLRTKCGRPYPHKGSMALGSLVEPIHIWEHHEA